MMALCASTMFMLKFLKSAGLVLMSQANFASGVSTNANNQYIIKVILAK